MDPNGLLLFQHKHNLLPVLPASLRRSVMVNIHIQSIHCGKNKLIQLIQRKYWWPNMQKDIRLFTSSCISCQKVKSNNRRTPGFMKLFPAHKPFQMIHMDIVGPLPVTSDGYRYFVSIIDRFSRFCMLIPVRNIQTFAVIQALEQWIATFGAPESILSDNGPQFISKMFHHFTNNQQIKQLFTVSYHPECNGMIERLHRWIKERLVLLSVDGGLDFVDGGDDWSDYLHVIQFTYNTTPNSMTSYCPFDIIYGSSPSQPLNITFDPTQPQQYMEYMINRTAIIKSKAKQAQAHYDKLRKRKYDKNKDESPYQIGDFVLYDISHKSVGNKRKLSPNYVDHMK